MIGICLLIYCKLIRVIKQRLKEFCVVLKTIPETYTEIYIQKLESFRDYIDFDKPYLDEEDLRIDFTECPPEQGLYKKKLANQISFKIPTLFLLLSIFLLSIFFIRTKLIDTYA